MGKLSKAQQEVVDKMRDGKELALIFPFWINRSPHYELDGGKVNSQTVEALKNNQVIKFSHKIHVGTTRHYYCLTEKYRKNEH